VRTKDTYSPVADNAEAYASLYEIYCSMYDGLQSQGVFDKIAAYQEKHCAESK